MGNSEQGCTCMRPRERSAVADSWRNQLSEEFEMLYRKGHKWAEQICSILILWDGRLDKYFRRQNRFEVYLKEGDSVLSNYLFRSDKKNLFKELEIDFKDSRNPIGAVLIQFSCSYTYEIIDEACEVDEEMARETVYKIADDVLTVVEILCKACFNFYGNANKVLKGKTVELRALLISCLVAGDLYRVLYDLASKCCKEANDELADYKSRLQISEIPLDNSIISTLRQISICESPSEKLYHLFNLKSNPIWKQEQTSSIWHYIYSSNLKDFFTHLLLIDLFTIEPMESSFDYFLSSLHHIEHSRQSTMI